MTNTSERYTDSEIDEFIELWNKGVATSALAVHFRRSPGALRQLVGKLTERGYNLKHGDERIEAIADYKAHSGPGDPLEIFRASQQAEHEAPAAKPRRHAKRRTYKRKAAVAGDQPATVKMTPDASSAATGHMQQPLAPVAQPERFARVEITTIVTVDGREVSKSSNTAYVPQSALQPGLA